MFIYVFSIEDRDNLISKNYNLIKSDERNNVYVFDNNDQLVFDNTNMKFVYSDILTF